jgi:prepilin-type N-terminal cleavage/methylation domain-containing protein
MKHISSKPGFTLIELLITVSLFVVVAGLTTSIFAGVSKLQVNRKSSQGLVAQLRQSEQQITADFQAAQVGSSADPTRKVLDIGTTTGAVLAIRRDITGGSEWRLYCVQNNATYNVNQLVRFRFAYTGTAPTISSASSCTSSGFTFSPALTTATVETLTDEQSNLQYVRFTQMLSNITPDNTFSQQANAVRLEVSAQDNALETTGLPLVFESTINRLTQ